MTARMCQCEHAAHFADSELHARAQTPNGNPGHRYGVKFYRLVEVKTDFGTFAVCNSCQKDCHAEVTP